MTTKTRISLPVLLPDIPSAKDACVDRLLTMLQGAPGVERVHLVEEGNEAFLCMHYDPEVTSVSEVEGKAKASGALVAQRYGHATFPIRSIAGEDADRRIEKAIETLPGVLNASVNLPGQVLNVEWERSAIDAERIEAEVAKIGVQPRKARPEANEDDHDHGGGWLGQHREIVLAISAGVFLVAGWLTERFAKEGHPIAIGLFLVSYALGGGNLAVQWIRSTLRGKLTFDIDLLMLLAAAGAAILGNWVEGAFLLFLFSLAHALEHYAMGRARNAIRALSDLTPDTALVQRDGKEVVTPIEEVRVGDLVIVHPGQRIPVDGKVQSGRSAVNQAPITGESVPVEKAAGDPVYAGSVNGDGALEVVNENAVGDRTLDRVVRLVEQAQTQKAPTEVFADRFTSILVPVVLVSDFLLIVVPPLLGLMPWSVSFYRGMALLVAASPCALALGTPAAVLTGIAQAARKGVLVKGGAHLENLGTVRAMAFDKTGTLTIGRPEVTDLAPAEGVDAKELLRVAASVESRSQHPLAQAVVRRADADSVARSAEVGELQSLTGRGVRSAVDGKTVELGNLRLWKEENVAVPPAIVQEVERLASEGKSILVVRHDNRWLGVVAVADKPRPSVSKALDRLRALGVERLVMLTGDNQGVGNAIGKQVGVDEVRAELMPEDKVTVIRDLLSKYETVAMTGDGVNDAPALANATVGIAMGGAGTAVALETADVALMGDDLAKLPFAVGLARQASRIIRQNLAIALGVIAMLVIATTTGLLQIGPAVVFHEGSTLVVLANALRLLTFDDKG